MILSLLTKLHYGLVEYPFMAHQDCMVKKV